MPKGIYPTNKGRTPWNKGIVGTKHTEEAKIKISLAQKGRKQSQEWINNRVTARKNNGRKWISEEQKKKMSDNSAHNKYWLGKKRVFSEEHIRKCLMRKDKSSLEKKFEDICIKNSLPYKFVGNGEFFIERKNPDFINCNGEKIAVEVYYRKHKEMFRNGLENWKSERQKIFNKYGWRIIYFDEMQVNEDNIIKQLR